MYKTYCYDLFETSVLFSANLSALTKTKMDSPQGGNSVTISNRILSNDHAITSDHLLPNSLWANTADTPPLTTQLSQSLQAEYLIIGGGYTGLSSALHLAEQGKSVIVLEATDIGFGGSGRNVGYVNASLWLNPDKVESCIGKDKGLQLFNTLVEGPEYVFSLIKNIKSIVKLPVMVLSIWLALDLALRAYKVEQTC